MIRTLRTLAPIRLTDARITGGNQRLWRAAFTVGLWAVIIQFAVSGNSLEDLGIPYGDPGGNPLIKLHPGTYLAAIACCMVLFLTRPSGSGVVRFFRATPGLAVFMLLILFCAFYSIVNVGFSGAAVYVESYLSAGLLSVALEAGTERQKRVLAWWIIGFVVLSIFISIGESFTQTHLIPMHIIETLDKEIPDDVQDFRGDGLFSHPLTAAVTTSMATFLLLRMRMPALAKGALFTLMLIGLLSFGGRAALLTTIVLLVLTAFVVLMRGVVTRNLNPGFLGAVGAAVLVLPVLLAVLVTSTDIGERVLSHMYLDDSADVRSVQWLVLNHLNLHDVLFGVPPDRMDVLKYQIGLGTAVTDIENFWLLMFLNLGSIGFIVFVIALGLFVAHLGRMVNHPLGWLLIVSAIVIDSSSNSLGRKSVDLVFMAACLIAMTGYPKPLPKIAMVPRRTPQPNQHRAAEGFGIRPSPVKLAGFKS